MTSMHHRSSRAVIRGILKFFRTPTNISKEIQAKPNVVSGDHLKRPQDVILGYARRAAPTSHKMAHDYHQLLHDLNERQKLYELDTGAEVVFSPREMSRRAAARAGLQLPLLNPELDNVDTTK